MTPTSSFLWGLFGSLLPEVLRFYKLATHDGAIPSIGVAYILISLAFIISAGLFTVAWKPENEFKAIWVGVSFPVLVSTLIQTPPSLPA